MAAIVVEDVVKRFGETVALDGVSFEVKEGTFFGCFGPNGAGKTTLLRILTGQIPPTSGTATVLGLSVIDEGMEIRRAVGIVPEVESPPSYLTAFEFLYFVGKLRRVDSLDERIHRWLDFFDLTPSKGTLCKDLSKGMRQKVMLSAAFMHEPRLLFLDEPFINLDPLYQRKLRDLLISFKEEGRTIFMCSHILEIAQRLCEEVVILSGGRVVAAENLSQMKLRGEDLETVFMRLVGGAEYLSP